MIFARVIIVSLLAAGLLIVGVGAPIASAQGRPPAPTNVSARDGVNTGEVVLSWDAVPGARFYRVGWVAYDDYRSVSERLGTQNWMEAFVFVNVRNRGQTSHTVTRLTPGTVYAFIVASNDTRQGDPQWSDWTLLTLRNDPLDKPLNRWTLGGSAEMTPSGSVNLTPLQNNQVGYVYHPEPMRFDSIVVRFAFEIGGGTGADGLGLLLVPAFPEDWVPGPTEASGWGKAMGSPLFDHGIGVYFDTWQNLWDTGDNLVSVNRLGSEDPEPYKQRHMHTPLSNGGMYYAEIYAERDRIDVYLSNPVQGMGRTLMLSTTDPGSVPREGYLGFLATTGGAFDRHIIHDVSLTTGAPLVD